MVRTFASCYIGKFIGFISRTFNLGSGFTWSGEIALRIDSTIIQTLAKNVDTIILVAGTNGKTTTAAMLKTLLPDNTFSNTSGANLLNGIAGSLIAHVSPITQKKKGIAIFEVDEATLPQAILRLAPHIVVLLNLFRDQLDRYGEVNTIAKKWHDALIKLPRSATVILNADDPQVAFLGEELTAQVRYIGMEKTGTKSCAQGELWGDSLYCPACFARLQYHEHIFSHLGNWHCTECKLKRPELTLNAGLMTLSIPGLFNRYNAASAILAVQAQTGQPEDVLMKKLRRFTPVFGRMETLTTNAFGKIIIMLSKNPTGFNENIRLLMTFSNVGSVLLVLNDRIPDGTDVSWIWDVEMEPLKKYKKIVVSGDRTHDMVTRLKYADIKVAQIIVEPKLEAAIKGASALVEQDKSLYILPTYSAMLEVRKIVLGRKIL